MIGVVEGRLPAGAGRHVIAALSDGAVATGVAQPNPRRAKQGLLGPAMDHRAKRRVRPAAPPAYLPVSADASGRSACFAGGVEGSAQMSGACCDGEQPPTRAKHHTLILKALAIARGLDCGVTE